jgi:hypothetical protein
MAAKKTLFMETTTVPAERTAAEITSCLVEAGATRIATEYADGKITGLRWTMRVGPSQVERMFSRPARVDPVYQIFRKRQKGYFGDKQQADLRAKAERVAWRQLLRWVQAQMAMIDAGMSEAGEIFFPYMNVEAGKTVYGFFSEQGFPMLPAPEKPQ